MSPTEIPDIEKLKARGDVKGLFLAYSDRELGMDIHRKAFNALLEIGELAVEPLILELKSKEQKSKAVFILGRIGDPRAVKPLIALTMEEDHTIRYEATEALGQIGDPQAVQAIISVLEDKDGVARKLERNIMPRAREVAIEALVKIGDVQAIDPLIAALDDSYEIIREAARRALSRFDDPKARQVLAIKQSDRGYQVDGEFAIYRFKETSLSNPLDLEARTEMYCVYCKHIRDPNLRDHAHPNGIGECSNYESGKNVISFNDSCDLWEPNTKVRFWLSKGYIQHNREGWPRNPWYQIFDDGPDGEKGTH